MSNQTATLISGVANVAIPTSDPERALTFYRDTLGLSVTRDATFGPGLRWIEVAVAEGATAIALAPRPADAPVVGTDTGIRLSTRDASAAHVALGSRGVDVDAQVLDLPGVPPMFSLRDPEGYTLYIVESATS